MWLGGSEATHEQCKGPVVVGKHCLQLCLALMRWSSCVLPSAERESARAQHWQELAGCHLQEDAGMCDNCRHMTQQLPCTCHHDCMPDQLSAPLLLTCVQQKFGPLLLMTAVQAFSHAQRSGSNYLASLIVCCTISTCSFCTYLCSHASVLELLQHLADRVCLHSHCRVMCAS
jgi:hypothetical protein